MGRRILSMSPSTIRAASIAHFYPRVLRRVTCTTVAVVLRTVLQKGRNVALERAKPRKGRFREEIGRREAQGGRGAEGGM